MKVIVSAGGRFHAHRLAQQLAQYHALQRLYTFDYAPTDHAIVNPQYVRIAGFCKLLDKTFSRLQLQRFVSRTHFNAFKDGLFDTFVRDKLIKEQHYDLFVGWAHYGHTSQQQARAAGAKIILESGSCHVTTHNELLQNEYKKYGLVAPAFNAVVKKNTLYEYATADYIVVPSTFAYNSFIAQGITPTKVISIPYGVDTTFFAPPINKPPQHKFIALFVGMVSLQKGIHYLLEAWNQAALPQETTELWLVGNTQKDFLTIAHYLPTNINIKFLGGVSKEQLRTIYHQASVFVLPSVQDGFGMVLGEAMATGLPVIASTHSGAPDIITTGLDGFLYSPYDVTALAKQLAWCYTNPTQAQTVGTHGQKTIQNFTWKTYGQRVYDHYKAILGHD